MNTLRPIKHITQKGFTLVEMMVVAPIVILLIGSFIALIVNLTGEVMSSRGSNVLAYDIQNALNRIEQDVKLSTTYLSVTNINTASTKQGYGGTTTTGGTTAFTNIDKTGSGGSPASLILNALVTSGNPLSTNAGLVYLVDKPNSCADYKEYSKNTPMTMNIVYFVKDNTLWRRVIMPSDYANASVRCGDAPWQIPSCINGYSASLTFCKSNDERLADGVNPSDFNLSYYASASSTTADTIAANQSVTNDTTRNTALQSTPTVNISIKADKTIAGRDISRTGSVRVTRLDTNASSIAQQEAVTAAPSVPTVSGTVSDGHNVTFTWPRVAGATSYSIDYRINSGGWQVGSTSLDNSERSYTVTAGGHSDTVEARVRASNSFGPSSYGTQSTIIPLWAPLVLKGNWTDYSSTYTPAAYTKTKSGFVLLRGMVKNGGTPSIGEILGSLPSDYKPSGRLIFGTSTGGNLPARVDVNPTADGTDIIFSTGGVPGWFSLDTIRYMSEDAGTRTALSFQNGYSNYGGTYSPGAWVKDSVGRVSIEGLLTGGTRTSGTVIASLPSTTTPPLTSLLPSWANGGYSDFGVQASPSALIARSSNATGWYSINTTYLPSSVSTTWNNLSFQNSWSNYGSIYATGQYTKTSDNVVELKGLIRLGANSYDSTIATLPVGFRPKYRLLLTTMQNPDAYARLDILPNGQIHFMGNDTGYYSISNIQFVAEE